MFEQVYLPVPKLTVWFKELNFFTESMVKKWKVLGETSPFRKLRIGDYTDVDGMLQSNDYKTKIRPGEHALVITSDNCFLSLTHLA